jgi:hypothetical protein
MLSSRERVLRTRVMVLVICALGNRPMLHAACLPPLPPCEALQKASIVVLVDVLETGGESEKIGPNTSRFIPQTVRLTVLERFKGIAEDQREIRAAIANTTAERILLTAGRTFLVYAYQSPSGLWNTGCTGTKPADETSDEVRQLRQCKSR